MKRRYRTGKQLLSGRQLFEMAKKGTSYYRKALAYASRKWDLDKNECKESGSTVDDVIEFVRVAMYKEQLSKDEKMLMKERMN